VLLVMGVVLVVLVMRRKLLWLGWRWCWGIDWRILHAAAWPADAQPAG
jgi:hypothetical protein